MGVWIRSQDKSQVTFCRTVKVWESGRIVNSLGKEYIHLGDYGTKEYALMVLDTLQRFIENRKNEDVVFQMPDFK